MQAYVGENMSFSTVYTYLKMVKPHALMVGVLTLRSHGSKKSYLQLTKWWDFAPPDWRVLLMFKKKNFSGGKPGLVRYDCSTVDLMRYS